MQKSSYTGMLGDRDWSLGDVSSAAAAAASTAALSAAQPCANIPLFSVFHVMASEAAMAATTSGATMVPIAWTVTSGREVSRRIGLDRQPYRLQSRCDQVRDRLAHRTRWREDSQARTLGRTLDWDSSTTVELSI